MDMNTQQITKETCMKNKLTRSYMKVKYIPCSKRDVERGSKDCK